MIKNILPDNSRNPESLKKILVESFLTSAHRAGKDLLWVFTVVVFIVLWFKVISKKVLYSKGFTSNWRDIFTLKQS